MINDQLRARLLRLARHRYGAGCEAEDAVQEALLLYWTRGCRWHEGRLVLEVKSQVRRIRRKAATREHISDDWSLTGH